MRDLKKFFLLIMFTLLFSFFGFFSFSYQVKAWCDGTANCGGHWEDVCPPDCYPGKPGCICTTECRGNARWFQCEGTNRGSCESFATSCGGCYFEGNCRWVSGGGSTPTPTPTLPPGAPPLPPTSTPILEVNPEF